MLYSLILAVVTAGLSIRFLLDDENTYLGKGIVISILFLGLLVPLIHPPFAIAGYVIQILLSIFLAMYNRFMNRQ